MFDSKTKKNSKTNVSFSFDSTCDQFNFCNSRQSKNLLVSTVSILSLTWSHQRALRAQSEQFWVFCVCVVFFLAEGGVLIRSQSGDRNQTAI